MLNAKIPLILGMSFFGDVAPVVDWKKRIVSVNGVKLPVVNDVERSVHVVMKTRPCATCHMNNSFANLDVKGSNEIDLNHHGKCL